VRKIIIFLSLLITSFLIIFSDASASASSTFKYEWSNTFVEVPLGASIESYKYKPYAILYQDGTALTDTSITYDTDGDWLHYLKNVNTNKIGDYRVWYKAYDSVYIPGTCIGYRALITFSVKDTIKPELKIIKDTIYLPMDSEYDFNNNIIATDNYAVKDIRFNQNVDFSKCGEYNVDVLVSDESGNYVTGKFNIVIYDDSTVPIITCSAVGDDIYIPVNMEYDIKQYFKAVDEKDGDITDKIVYPSIDNTMVTDYDYTVSVANNKGHTASYTVKIHVVDEEEPVLVLNTHSLMLDYKTDFSNYNFNQHIKSLTDNIAINMDNLKIEYTMENKIGNYVINYEYTDNVYTVRDSIDVNLISYQSPKIVVSDISVNENTNINLKDYISVIDESDEYIAESIEIDDKNVDYENEGTYYATVFCMNSSGLSSQVKFKVIVTSDSLFSKANLGITITAIILFVLLIGGSITIGIYLYIKKKKSV
jgi:hypothetical protein